MSSASPVKIKRCICGHDYLTHRHRDHAKSAPEWDYTGKCNVCDCEFWEPGVDLGSKPWSRT